MTTPRRDQAPLSPYIDDTPTDRIRVVPNPAQQPKAFTRTSLGKVAGHRFPTNADHPDFPDPRYPGIVPPDVVANPDNAAATEVLPSDKKRGWGRYVAFGAAGLAALTVAGFAIGFGGAKGAKVALNNEQGADKSNSAEPFPGTNGNPNPGRIETQVSAPLDIYNTDIMYEDYGRQLDVLMPFMQEHGDEIPADYRAKLDSTYNDAKENQTLPKHDRLVEAQGDINRLNKWLYIASDQKNTTLGRNLVGLVYTPDTNTHKAITLGENNEPAQIDGVEPITARKRVIGASDTFLSGTFGKTRFDTETKVVKVYNANNASDPKLNLVISKFTSQDGKYSTDVIAGVYKEGDPSYVDDVNDWTPSS